MEVKQTVSDTVNYLEEKEEVKETVNPVNIVITVHQAKILKGPRNVPFISIVTMKFGEKSMGISDHCELQEDNTFDYKLIVNFECHPEDYYKIDELISKPLILTVSESAGISKNAEDTVPLCVCSIDLMPILLSPELSQSCIYTMQFFNPPVKPPPIEPQVELHFDFSSRLLSDKLLKQGNILQVTLESCYSLPEELVQSTTKGDCFAVGFLLPLLKDECDEPIIFRNGVLQMGPVKNYEIEKKWYTVASDAAGKALRIADSYIKSENLDEDLGDFQDEKDREYRKACAEQTQISWNVEFRSLMSPSCVKKLIQHIRKYKFLPVEFVRVSGSGRKKDDGSCSFYGVAYVNLTPLLFPGVNEIHGAYQLHPLSEAEMKMKTNKSSLLIRGTPSRQGSAFLASIVKQKSLGREGGGDNQKGSNQPEVVELLEETTSEIAILFEEKRTHITLTITFHRALVPQRPPEEIHQKISEFVPVRNVTFLKLDPGQKAVDDFGIQVCNTAAMLLEEYKNLLIKDAVGTQTKDRLTTQDYRKTKFLHELKKNGKYFTCKEQLKYHIVKIVRDKFMRRSGFEFPRDFEEFLSSLYVYLMEEMHHNLNNYLGMSDLIPSPPAGVIVSSVELKLFAIDALAVGREDLARKYHQERIARYESDPRCWVDYGIYCLAVKNFEKAAECFYQSISLSRDYFRGLLLYGIVCDVCGRNDQTELFLLHAINLQPSSALAKTIIGLYYHGIGNSIGADTYFKQAQQLMTENNVELNVVKYSASSLSIKTVDDQTIADGNSIFIASLPFLLNCYISMYAQRALAQELTNYQCKPPSSQYYLFLAKLHFQGEEYNLAESAIREAIDYDNMNPDIWSLCGHIYAAVKNKSKAKQSFNRALAIAKQPMDMPIIYYKLATMALEDCDYETAKKYYLLTCKHSPSCLSWMGVGRASYELGEWIDAEDALSEANILDNTNPEVWGYLTLVCLKTGRKVEVEQAYRFTCRCNLQDQSLMAEIHRLAKEVNIQLTPV